MTLYHWDLPQYMASEDGREGGWLEVADALRDREELLRVAPAQHRVEERAVRNQVEAVHGVRVTAADLQIARDRKLWLAARLGAHGLAHEAMREVDVVHGAERERAGWLATAGPHTEMGWNIDPDALYETLVRLNDNYPGMPLVVTENGMACPDKVEVGPDGVKMVHDNDRIDYLHRHLEAVYRAIEEGTDVRGYFAWSLMDNFEWAFGYSKRFGLTYVDYESQERIKKDSFEWYRRFIADHSAR